MKLTLIAVLIGELTVTSYRSVPSQTDSTPFHTSTNERVAAGGVAVSRDRLCGACRKLHRRCKHPEYAKKLHYGDWLYVDGYGFRRVNDCMGETSTTKGKGRRRVRRVIRNQIDIWVATPQQEKAVGFRRANVYKVEVPYGWPKKNH